MKTGDSHDRKDGASPRRTTVRLVVSDVDGTLLRDDGSLAPATRRAVQQLRRAGLPLALCTARPPRTVEPIYHSLRLVEPLAAYNGALIYRPGTGEQLIHHAMDRETAVKVLAVFSELAPTANVGLELADEWHVNRMDDRLREAIASGRVAATPQVGDLGRVLQQTRRQISKIYLIAALAQRQKVRRRLAAVCGAEIAVTSSGENFLEVSAAAANKGTALRYLAGRLDVPLAATAYLGDAENDLPAITLAGLSVAMGQAPAAVKEQAQRVAPANSEDGWAKAVTEWVLAPATGRALPSDQAVQE